MLDSLIRKHEQATDVIYTRAEKELLRAFTLGHIAMCKGEDNSGNDDDGARAVMEIFGNGGDMDADKLLYFSGLGYLWATRILKHGWEV